MYSLLSTGSQSGNSGSGGTAGSNVKLLSRVFGGSSDEEAAAAAAAASMNTGDPAAAIEEQQSELDEAKGRVMDHWGCLCLFCVNLFRRP